MHWMPCCGLAVVLSVVPSAWAGPHVDLIDFPRTEANWDRAYDLEAALAAEFSALCADTLCEGDYSNYRVMQFRCAVREQAGTVQRCAWVVAASELAVQADTGVIQVADGRWVCPVDLRPGVPVEAFHASLAAPGGLVAPLPVVGRSLFSGLFECLQGPGVQP
ncbi:hypothetical protein C1924_16280 [Stenotrophomonas sp. ESTM1D_MKCIP4_1]|nr:hypothetical protein C1924_16280 [Stenotrophomonas sp. ESTM1D_MKCIP4_1]